MLIEKTPNRNFKAFNGYLNLRAVSSIGDEIVQTCLPLFAVATGWNSGELGLVVSATSASSLAAYALAPLVFHRRRSLAATSAILDFLQVILFAIGGLALYRAGAVASWWIIAIVMSAAHFLGGWWYLTNEALLPRLKELGSAQEIQRKNFLSYTLGATVGPAIAAVTFSAVGMPSLLFANALSFLGQCFYLKKLSKFETLPSIQLRRISLSSLLSSGLAVFKIRSIALATFFSSFVRVFTMGFIPFVIFRYQTLGLEEKSWIAALVLAYPAAMLLGVKCYNAKSDKGIVRAFTVSSALFVLSGFAVVWSTLTGQPPLATVILLIVFGATVGVFTVLVRALRQLIVPADKLADVVGSQTLWARSVAPLSGIIFGLVLADDELRHVATLAIAPLVAVGLVLVAAQHSALKQDADKWTK